MSLESYASLAEIIGVTLVVPSLIYVAIQLRQNTNAVRAQSRQAVLTASQAELFVQIERPEISLSIINPSVLTQEEQVRLSSFFFAVFRAREFAWLQHENGVIDDAQWDTEAAVIMFFIDSHRVRDWWIEVGSSGFSVQFSTFIDRLIEANSPTDSTFRAVASWADKKHENQVE